MPGCQVLGLAVGVNAGVLGSGVSGRGQCRVAAFGVSGLLELAILFITISHCAWRHVISFSAWSAEFMGGFVVQVWFF